MILNAGPDKGLGFLCDPFFGFPISIGGLIELRRTAAQKGKGDIDIANAVEDGYGLDVVQAQGKILNERPGIFHKTAEAFAQTRPHSLEGGAEGAEHNGGDERFQVLVRRQRSSP